MELFPRDSTKASSAKCLKRRHRSAAWDKRMISRPLRCFLPQTIQNGLQEKLFSSRGVCVSIEENHSGTRKETDMKTKFLCVALLGSATIIVQANPGGYRGGGGGFHGGAVAHAAPAAHAP